MSDEKKDQSSGGDNKGGKRKRRRYFRRKRKGSGNKGSGSNQSNDKSNDQANASKGSNSNQGGNNKSSKSRRKRRSRRRKSSRRQRQQNQPKQETPQIPDVPENPNYVEPTDVYVHTHIVRPAYRDNLSEYRSEPLFHYAGSGSVLNGSAMDRLAGEINQQLDKWFAEVGAPPKKVQTDEIDRDDGRYQEYTNIEDEDE